MAKKKAEKKPEKKSGAFDALAARRKLLEVTIESIEYAEFDKRASLIREARSLITDIAGVSAAAETPMVKEKGGQVVDFQERLAKHRSSGSKAPGRRRSQG